MRCAKVVLIICVISGFALSQQSSTTNLSDIVAEVNGEKITVQDVLYEFSRLTPDAQQSIISDANGKADLLNSIIKKKLLVLDAKKRGIDTLNFVQDAVKRAAEDIYVQVLINQVQMQNSNVSEQEVQDFYNKNDTLFNVPVRYHIAQIVLPDKKTADDVYKRLSKGKLSWDEATQKYPGVGNNKSGDGGWIFANQIVPQASRLIEKLKPGEFTEPVSVGDIYYIVKVIESEPPRKLSLDEVKDRISRALSQQKGQQAIVDYQNRLYMQAKISIDNSVLNSINLVGQR